MRVAYMMDDWALAIRHWREADPVMARLAASRPPRRLPLARGSGFSSLVVALLHQQVSLAAGRSITRRLQAACGGRITPSGVLALPAAKLRGAGVSRQKQGYILDLARRTLSREVDFRLLAKASDADAVAMLTRVKGIGVWTAKMFLLFHLRRPDVVAPEDLGLRIAVTSAYGLPMDRAAAFLATQGPRWSPYGSLACLTLWAHKDALREGL